MLSFRGPPVLRCVAALGSVFSRPLRSWALSALRSSGQRRRIKEREKERGEGKGKGGPAWLCHGCC